MSAIPLHAPTPRDIGIVAGVLLQGSQFGFLIGPPALAAAVIGFGGWQHGVWLLTALGIVNVFLALVLRRIERGL